MYLSRRFYIIAAVVIVVVALGAAVPQLIVVGRVLLWLLVAAVVADCCLLWMRRHGIGAIRTMAQRFSNGDDNEVSLHVESDFPIHLRLNVIDEIPVEFQDRHVSFRLKLRPHEGKTIVYRLRPTKRGSYDFGLTRVFTTTLLGLVERRHSLGRPQSVKVYPSFLMLRHYELLAISRRLTDIGIKRIRRPGNNTEMEQIRDYVVGDDFRTINWKATARRGALMVNEYQAERSQQVISVIDEGRAMQQTSRGLTLLDSAINASLVLSYVAMSRDDKAGLITFGPKVSSYIAPRRQSGQLSTLLDGLYNEHTTFAESDFSALLGFVNANVRQRSLLILYTSLPDMVSLRRKLPYLRQLAQRHRLIVVFFADRELRDFITQKPRSTEDYYQQTIARRYDSDQRLVASTLRQNSILTILTLPEQLSVDVINKYLELKSANMV